MVACAHCKSTDTKRLEAIVSQGSKEVDLGTLIGLAGISGSASSGMKLGALGGKAGTKGTIQSSLSKKIESLRPKKPSLMKMIFLGPFLAIITIGFLFGPKGNVGVGIFMLVVLFFYIYNFFTGRKNFPNKLDRFKRTWYCFKCDRLSVTKN